MKNRSIVLYFMIAMSIVALLTTVVVSGLSDLST